MALSRFGGLRCPSEVLSVRWADVDWKRGRIVVTSPKTEHHEGKGSRVIPIFPELRPTLEEACDAAPEGAVYIVNERYRKSAMGPNGWRNCNLATQLNRIRLKAGITWPGIGVQPGMGGQLSERPHPAQGGA